MSALPPLERNLPPRLGRLIVDPNDVFADRSYAQSCRRYRKPPETALRKYLAALEALLGGPVGSHPVILDAGCGAGVFTLPLARLANAHGGGLIALDSSRVMLESVRRLLDRHDAGHLVTVRHGDVLSMEPHSPCALVWASDLVHLMPDIDAFSASVRRFLKCEGALAIRMSSAAQLESYEWGAFFPKALAIDLSRHHDTDAVCESLTRNGFHDVEVAEIDESQWMPTERYLRLFESRYLSSLRLIDDAEFIEGLARMKRTFRGCSRVLRNARTTLITVRRS